MVNHECSLWQRPYLSYALLGLYPAKSKYTHICWFTKEVSKSSEGLNKVDIALFAVVWSLNHVQLFATPMDCSLQGSSAHGIF